MHALLQDREPATGRSQHAVSLRVVSRPSFSALPHAVLFDPALSHGQIVLYAILQSYWWQSGECYASHTTLAEQLGVKERMLRYNLRKLIAAGHVCERRRGQGQAKVYAPTPSGNTLPVEAAEDCQLNRQPVATSEANRQLIAEQPATDCQFKRQPVAARRRLPEEDAQTGNPPEGEVAADAAPPPAVEEASKPKEKARRPRRSREDEGTLAPDTIDLTDQSYATAARWGFSREDVGLQLERFLSKARAKGWRYLNWKEAFRNWLLNEVSYARRDGRSVSAPGRPKPPRPDDHLPSTVHRVPVERIGT